MWVFLVEELQKTNSNFTGNWIKNKINATHADILEIKQVQLLPLVKFSRSKGQQG